MSTLRFRTATSRFSGTVAALVVAVGMPLVAAAAGAPQPGDSPKARPSCCAGEHDDTGMKSMSMEKTCDAPDTAYSRSMVEVQVPDVTLVDASGAQVSLRSLVASDDAPVMLNFIFTSCTTICPVLSATFAKVDGELGREQKAVRLISITIDPEYDTPERLRDYAERHQADARWHFLTGSRDVIDTVQKAFGAYRGSKFNHAPLTFIHRRGATDWVRLEGLGDADGLLAEYRRSGSVG